jgi:hypothetical protein
MGPGFDAQNFIARNLTPMNFRMSDGGMKMRDGRVVTCDAVILKAGASERPAVITVGCWP